MASYKIEWKRSVYNDLKKIDKRYISKIVKQIDSLSGNPHPKGCKKLDTDRTFRFRVGDYRVIYRVDDEEKVVLIEYIRH